LGSRREKEQNQHQPLQKRRMHARYIVLNLT